jgi:hypothetical protein
MYLSTESAYKERILLLFKNKKTDKQNLSVLENEKLIWI